MTVDLQSLLAVDPLQALVLMVNAQENTKFRMDGFTVSTPVAVDGLATRVVLTGRPEAAARDRQIAVGSITLNYRRLDIATWLANSLAGYAPDLPLSTQDILNEISRRSGQAFYIDDMVLEEITRDNGALYRLRAKPESLRWVGTVNLPVIETIPITQFLSADALAGLTDHSPVRYLPGDAIPYLNATDLRDVAQSLNVGDLGQNRIAMQQLFNDTVPDPDFGDELTHQPWVVSSNPVPFNLFNAKVVRFESGLLLNPGVPLLDTAIVITLDGAFCTNFVSGEIAIPYTVQDFEADGYTQFPRVTHNSVVSLSDGTAYAPFLNRYREGDIITSLPDSPPLLLEGNTPWECIPGLPTDTNLSAAKVTYNGQLRAADLPAATQGLDRILVVSLSKDNAVWQGEYPFYYAGGARLASVTYSGSVGSTVAISLVPTQGTAPYAYAMVAGTVPDGLVFNATTGILGGTYTKQGGYTYNLSVTDGNGDSWLFNITHNVTAQIFELSLTGTLPDGVMGETYFGFLDLAGGLTPYGTPTIIAGDLPPSIRLEVVGTTIQASGLWPAPDTYFFAVGITSADGQSTSSSQRVTVTGDATEPTDPTDPTDPTTPDPSIVGTLPAGTVNTPYSASLTLTGGPGTFQNARVLNSTLPQGLSLFLANDTLSVLGVPSQAFSGDVTLAVDTPDARTATTDQAVKIIDVPVQQYQHWLYKVTSLTDSADYTAVDLDTSTWAEGAAPFGNADDYPNGLTAPNAFDARFVNAISTRVDLNLRYWLRRDLILDTVPEAGFTFTGFMDNSFTFYVNGVQVVAGATTSGVGTIAIIPASYFQVGTNVLVAKCEDDAFSGHPDACYFDFLLDPRTAADALVIDLPFSGTDGSTTFTDHAGKTTWAANGQAKLSSTKPFLDGSVAGYFDGAGDYLLASTASIVNFAGTDYTVSVWTNADVISTVMQLIGIFADGDGRSWVMSLYNSGGKPSLITSWSLGNSYDASRDQVSNSNDVVANTWVEVMMVRQRDTLYAFVAGKLVGTFHMGTDILNTTVGSRLKIGGNNQNQWFKGALKNLKVYFGYAQHTADYTPTTPTA